MADVLIDTLRNLTVAELQAELKSRGLKKSGNKAALIERLSEYIIANETSSPSPVQSPDDDEKPENDHIRLVQDTRGDEPAPVEEMDTETINKEVPVDSMDDTDEDSSLTKHLAEPIHKEENSEDNMTNGRVVDIRNDSQDSMPEATEDISNITEERDIRVEESHKNEEEEEEEEETKDETHQQQQQQQQSPDKAETDMQQEEDSNDNKEDLLEKPITAVLHEEEALDYEEFDEETEETPQDGPSEDKEEDEDKETEEVKDKDEKEETKKGEEEEDGEIKDEEKQAETVEVKVQKPQPKPVHIKKSTVSLAAISSETAEERAAKRKRRWGSTTLKNFSTPVDASSIKKLIPDLTVDATDVPDKLSYHTDENESSQEGASHTPKKGRTVKLDSAKKVVLGKKTEPEVIDLDKETEVVKKPKISIALTDDDDDDVMMTDERRKSPSPPKNGASVYLYIENLVRPFTNRQLKSLIEKSGEIVENGFWINGIKSFCYVQMNTEEDAVTTREALHGIRWPSGNPKRLKVDFAIADKMYAQTNGELGEKPKEVVEIPDQVEDAEKQKKRDRKGSESGRTRKTKAEETPVKLLDDLFRKTKATPCIYWLPLSDEEIAKRETKQKDSSMKHESDKKERTRSPERRRSPDRRNRSPVRRNRSPLRRSKSPDRRRSRGWR